MRIFETHAHYNAECYNEDRDLLLGRTLPDAGIEYVINVGTDLAGSEESVKIAEKYDYIYASVGFHPHYASQMDEAALAKLTKMTANERVVAVGEIGLDYHYDNSPRDAQIFWFKKQLEMASQVGLPVIIHSRDADCDTYSILSEWVETLPNMPKMAEKLRNGAVGVIHCFSQDYAMAEKYVKMGFYIGVGGFVTYKNAAKLVEIVKNIPLERILTETDCPYLSPVPFRGQRNSSQNLTFIIEKISEIAQISQNDIAKITLKNAQLLFDIK